MTNSDSSTGGNEKSVGQKLGIASLLVGGWCITKFLIDSKFGPGTSDQIATPLFMLLSPALDLGSNIVADRICNTVFSEAKDTAGVTGLNYDVERALARAASRSYRLLIAEWRKIPQTERLIDQHVWELERIERACDAYLAKSERGFEPSVIADWLRELDLANFPQFPDSSLVPWKHESAGEPPQPPLAFADWFHWRFPAAFRLNFADELSRDEPARAKFSLLLKERILTLQGEKLAATLGMQKQLDGLVADLADPTAPWVRNIAQAVREELKTWQPELVAALLSDISPVMIKLLGRWAGNIIGAVNKSAKKTQAVIRTDGKKTRKSLKALHEKVEVIEKAVKPKPSAKPPTWEQQVEAYEHASTMSFNALRVATLGGVSGAEAVLTLSGLYVDPACKEFIAGPIEGFMTPHDGGEKIPVTMEHLKSTSGSILRVLRRPEQLRHIVLGGAGMGKSSVLRTLYLDWALRDSASGALLQPIVAGASRPLESHSDGAARLGGGTPPLLEARVALPVPILIEIREFLGARGRAVERVDHHPVENILDYLTQTCGRAWCFDRAALLGALDEGRAWLLVDGLDEAFDPEVRKRICDWLRSFASQHQNVRIIASSRVIGFAEHEWPLTGVKKGGPYWSCHTLCPFDQKRRDEFLTNWFRAKVPGVHIRDTMREEVAKAIASRPFLKPLAEVPLTLTMICAIGQRGIQFDSRTDVFREAVKIFIQKWDHKRELEKSKADIVERWRNYGEVDRMSFFRTVAMKMVEGGNPDDSNRISLDDLLTVLVKKFKSRKVGNSTSLADETLKLICERNFLLTELPGDAYAFLHRSFLEYFTALGWAERYGYLTDGEPNESNVEHRMFFEKVILPRWANPTWHDTFRFLFGVLPTVPAARCLQLLWNIKANELPQPGTIGDVANDEIQWAAKVLAAELAAELRPYTPEDGESVTSRSISVDWKAELLAFCTTMWQVAQHGNAVNFKRLELRLRALGAVALLWQGDVQTAYEIAKLLLRDSSWVPGEESIGLALAVVLPGRSKAFALLRDIVEAPYTNVAVASKREKAPPQTPSNTLAPFVRGATATNVRRSAVVALGAGWAQDEQARAVLMCAVIGDKEAEIARDRDPSVRETALIALWKARRGDEALQQVFAKVVADDTEDKNVKQMARELCSNSLTSNYLKALGGQ